MKENTECDIYEKLTNRVNRQTFQLQEGHKIFLVNLFDEQLQATRDAIDSLTTAFEGVTLKESQVGTFIKNEYTLTVKRTTCHFEARNAEATLLKRKEWVEKWSKIDMNYLRTCVFMDDSVFDINMRQSTVRSAKGTLATLS